MCRWLDKMQPNHARVRSDDCADTKASSCSKRTRAVVLAIFCLGVWVLRYLGKRAHPRLLAPKPHHIKSMPPHAASYKTLHTPRRQTIRLLFISSSQPTYIHTQALSLCPATSSNQRHPCFPTAFLGRGHAIHSARPDMPS